MNRIFKVIWSQTRQKYVVVSELVKRGGWVLLSATQKLTLDFHVIVSYGVSISAVTNNLIDNVKYKVEEFTGLEVEKINIFVE